MTCQTPYYNRPYQAGMQPITLDGCCYDLLLTMGALREISVIFNASGPLALAEKLKHLSDHDARLLLCCLIYGPQYPNRQQAEDKTDAVHISDQDLQQALPKICQIIEEAFAGSHHKAA